MKWLKHANMKDVVDAGIIGQAQAIGDGSNMLDDLKGASKAWTELAMEAQHQ